MQIVVCNHFQFVDDECFPEEADDAMLYLKYAQHTDCSTFQLTVFKNAVQIIVSNQTASKFSKCGQVIYGMSDTGDLVSVLITNMSAEDIAHTQLELSIGIEQ